MANPVQARRVQALANLANTKMPPPGQPPEALPKDDDEQKPQNAQDGLFGEVQAEFARPAALAKIKARVPAPGRK